MVAAKQPFRVTTDKVQTEHNASGVHLWADIGADIDLRSEGPLAEVPRRPKPPRRVWQLLVTISAATQKSLIRP